MSASEHYADLPGSSSTGGWANVSGQVYGFVDPHWDVDWYVTHLTAGVRYTVRLWSGGFDAVLTLRDAAGSAVAAANDHYAGGTETLTFTPATSGVYYLDARSYQGGADRTGFYVLGLASTARDDFAGTTATTSTLVPGQPRAGAIEIAADADWHRVSLQAGKTYTVAASGSLPKAYLKLFDADGVETGVDGVGSLTFVAASSGV